MSGAVPPPRPQKAGQTGGVLADSLGSRQGEAKGSPFIAEHISKSGKTSTRRGFMRNSHPRHKSGINQKLSGEHLKAHLKHMSLFQTFPLSHPCTGVFPRVILLSICPQRDTAHTVAASAQTVNFSEKRLCTNSKHRGFPP